MLPAALFAGIVGFQILGPVPIGLADNRDFARVLGPLRLWPASAVPESPDAYFNYFVNDYAVHDPRYDAHVPSSEWLVAALAKKIGIIILPPGSFQLRLMGLIHALLFMVALLVFIKALETHAWWLRLGSSLLLVFIWTDLETVQQFNTAYTDAGAVAALAIVFAISVHTLLVNAGWRWALGFALSGCFLLTTKTQHLTAAPFLAGFCVLIGFRNRRHPDCAVWFAVPVLFLAASAWMLLKTPDDYRAPAAFTLVFYKLATLAPHPKEVLADLNMPDDEFGKYVGHFAYESVVPIDDLAFRKRIRSLVTPAIMARFYWRHPGLAGKALLFDLSQSAPYVNLTGLGYGHMREIDVRRRRQPFELRFWSGFRQWLFSPVPLYPVYLFAGIGIFSGLYMLWPRIARRFPVWPVVGLMAALAVSSFLLASLSDGVESQRHLVFFQAATDLTIFACSLAAALALERRAGGPCLSARGDRKVFSFQ